MLAHFECFSGISGDMTLGALIDLGVPPDWLISRLQALDIGPVGLETGRTFRHGIAAVRVKVTPEKPSGERHYSDISRLIRGSDLPVAVIERSIAIFDRIAEAEARIHGVAKEKVHFHEVGGIDAIVDIVGTALCLDYLRVTGCSASPVALGTGLVRSSHGILPVPSPATVAILRDVPVRGTDIPFELTTPTGAAIVAVSAEAFGRMPPMTIKKVGYGAGARDHEAVPNLLRVILGRPAAETVDDTGIGYAQDNAVVLETNIDDMNPEMFGYVMETLLRQGAHDVCFIPVFMKKNRPATMMQVICSESRAGELQDTIFRETTTLGIRCYRVSRRTLHRRAVTVNTRFGPVAAKKAFVGENRFRIVPEYESCRKIAAARGVALQTVYMAALSGGETAHEEDAGR